jgi:RNA polymerase sigma factor (TIGR02999 family)
MTEEVRHDLTALLQAWRNGDRAALDGLWPLAYRELHRVAHHYMARERPEHTLQTSALINEAYVRLVEARKVDWRDRAHFFAIAAGIMRKVLIDYARLRQAGKRGSGARRFSLDEALIPSPEQDDELIALHEALSRLADSNAREARVVELRFFGDLSEREIAHVLDLSERTVRREWEHAKAWLVRELKRRGTT